MPEIVEITQKNAHWHAASRMKLCIACKEQKPLSAFSSYRYTTRQGKISSRYESRCRDCARKRAAEYRETHPDVVARQNASRAARDPDMFKRLSKQYRNTEKGRRIKAKLQRLRKARLRSGAADDAAVRAIYDKALTVEHLVKHCPVFDIPELGKKMHVDHILPLSRGGQHIAENLQILPAGLNLRKGSKCPK